VNAAARLISFRILQFGTVALIQDAHVNMPFQSWELRPRTTNHAQLTITAAVVEVEIQIKVRAVSASQSEPAWSKGTGRGNVYLELKVVATGSKITENSLVIIYNTIQYCLLEYDSHRLD